RAVAQGNAKAARNLAYLYYFGRGVPRDPERAAELFAEAAADGESRADYNLGFIYYNGKGVPRDLARAAEHLRAAALRGDADSQIFLARMHLFGAGVPQDLQRAYFWTLLGAAQKPKLAEDYFDLLRGRPDRPAFGPT